MDSKDNDKCRKIIIKEDLVLFVLFCSQFRFEAHFWFTFFTFIQLLLFTMSNFNFILIIKEDVIIKNYPTYTLTIHNEIIDTTNKSMKIEFNNLRTFLLLVYVRDDKINIVHYILLGAINIIMKHLINSKSIKGLLNKKLRLNSRIQIKKIYKKEKF